MGAAALVGTALCLANNLHAAQSQPELPAWFQTLTKEVTETPVQKSAPPSTTSSTGAVRPESSSSASGPSLPTSREVDLSPFISDSGFDYQKAEQYLNNSYKQCLARLAPQQKEQVRIPQRAWIKYSDHNETACKALGLSESQIWSLSLVECVARGSQLQHYFDPPNADSLALQSELRQAEDTLTNVYRQIIGRLSGPDRTNLIEAERAWVEYKEKNTVANARVNPMGGGFRATISVIKRRTEELQAIYK